MERENRREASSGEHPDSFLCKRFLIIRVLKNSFICVRLAQLEERVAVNHDVDSSNLSLDAIYAGLV